MMELLVSAVENGFIVREGGGRMEGLIGRSWAFESANTLAEFMLAWGSNIGEEKPNDQV